MAKHELKITLQIKGRDWEFSIIPDKTFDKIHNPNDEGHSAMTLPNQYKVQFRKSDWCIKDIRHELGHVLKHMSHTGSVDLSAADMEELMCDQYASNYADVGLWTDKIAEKFFGRE
jgi:hypothetical protein